MSTNETETGAEQAEAGAGAQQAEAVTAAGGAGAGAQQAEAERPDNKNFFRNYFGNASPAKPEDVRANLWTKGLGPPYADQGSKEYASAVLEQYKMYVEMADRVSARRGLTNTFFLTLNSAIFTAIGFFWTNHPHAATWLLIFPAIVLIAECMAWFWLVRSYRQLNSGKYAVVGALEERLPASPYYNGEWKALGSGKDPARYWPITHLEQWIPILFAASYLGGYIAIMLA